MGNSPNGPFFKRIDQFKIDQENGPTLRAAWEGRALVGSDRAPLFLKKAAP